RARGVLSAAEEADPLRLTRAIEVRRARDRQAHLPDGAPSGGAGISRADGAPRGPTAAAGEGVEAHVPAEATEDVRLVRQINRGLRDRARVEHEADRQR